MAEWKAEEFEQRRRALRMSGKSRTAMAARFMLVDGLSLSEASRQVNISASVVSRGVDRLRAVKLEEVTCPECGHAFVP